MKNLAILVGVRVVRGEMDIVERDIVWLEIESTEVGGFQESSEPSRGALYIVFRYSISQAPIHPWTPIVSRYCRWQAGSYVLCLNIIGVVKHLDTDEPAC